MNRILTLTTTFLLMLLVGCVGKQIAYHDAQAQEGKAVIYVYRPNSFVNSAETMILEINNVEIDYLSNGGYRYTMVEPGEIKVVVKKNIIPFNEYGTISVKDIKAGQSYYIKADPVAFGGFDMTLMDENLGRQEASASKLYVPE